MLCSRLVGSLAASQLSLDCEQYAQPTTPTRPPGAAVRNGHGIDRESGFVNFSEF